MANTEMLVIKRGYDFSKWLLQHTGKFPQSYRFSVAAKLENGVLDFIEATTVASMNSDRVSNPVRVRPPRRVLTPPLLPNASAF